MQNSALVLQHGLRPIGVSPTRSYILIQRKIARLGLTVLGLAVGLSFLTTNEASAKGCNGVVNQLVWGCAPWDNNNGPQFPNYKKKGEAAKPAAAPQPAVAQPQRGISPNASSGIVSGGAGNIVSGGAGNIVSGGAGNAVHK